MGDFFIKIMNLTSNINIKKTVFNSGLTLITEHIPSYRSASVGVWVKSGSRFEDKENIGVVHFIEHMLFKGTETRSAQQIAASIEELGGSINAFTGKEETCFYAHILDSHIDIAIEVLGDMMCNSVFKKKDIKLEKQVIIEEIKAVQDTPDEYVFDVFNEKVFPENALGYPILGSIKDVKRIDINCLQQFYNNHYCPENIILSVAGNIDHNQIEKLVSRHFTLKTGPLSKNFSEVIPKSSILWTQKAHLNQAHICVGNAGVNYTHESRYNLIALNAYLGGGLSSRLFQVLREERGLVYSIFSFLDFFIDTGIIGFYLGTDPDNKNEAIECLKKELEKVSTDILSESQVDNLKEQIKGNYFLAMESTFKRMSRLAKNEIYHGRQISEQEIINNINKITPNSICEAAKIYLNSSVLNTIILSPGKN